MKAPRLESCDETVQQGKPASQKLIAGPEATKLPVGRPVLHSVASAGERIISWS